MPSTPEVVVITGASGGVGRATAREFARRGAHIGLVARGHTGLAAARREVEQLGGVALELPLDVADADAVDRAAAQVEDRLGPIDVWVNAAMVGVLGELKDVTPDEYRRVTDVTYLGYVWGTMAALKRMQPRDRGTIVLVGSALAYRGIPLQAAYCGAKHAIQGFSESLRCELLHDGSEVWVTMVQMPALNTPQFSWCRTKLDEQPQPVPPIYQPEVAAKAIWWAAHHRRREVYVGGSTAVVVTGNKLAPGLGDRYLARTGFDSQHTSEPLPADRRDNLFAPADDDRDFGAHGELDAKARSRSIEAWASRHKRLLQATTLGLAAAAAMVGVTRTIA